MQPLTIIPDFDIGEHRLPGLGKGLKVRAGDAFRFQRMKKALHGGIIPAVALATHGGEDPMRGEHLLIGAAGVLTPPIRMVEQPGSRLPAAQRRDEGREGERLVEGRAQRPPDDLPGAEVHDGGETPTGPTVVQ